MNDWPKISIITPSYNQGEFLEETILSVLNQRYANLEFMVVDGGSTDHSLEIIHRHARNLAWWTSEKDRGQTHAINKGLERATGDIVTYLNSDDLLLPGALHAVGRFFMTHTRESWLTGDCLFFGDVYPCGIWQFDPVPDVVHLLIGNQIAQPATFWKRRLTSELGLLDDQLNYCMDYEYWLRFMNAGKTLRRIQVPLAAFRHHGACKTNAQKPQMEAEYKSVQQRYLAGLNPSQLQLYMRLESLRKARFGLDRASDLRQSGKLGDAWKQFFLTIREHPLGLRTRHGLGCLRRLILGSLLSGSLRK